MIHLSKITDFELFWSFNQKQNCPFGVRSPALLPYIGYFHHELRIDDYPVLFGINPDKHHPKVKTWKFSLS